MLSRESAVVGVWCGSDVCVTDPRCEELYQAAEEGDEGRVRALLEAGVRPDDYTSQDEYKNTALHEASLCGHTAIVQQLLQHGASVHVTSALGVTALHLACAVGRVEVLPVLLQAGSHLDARIMRRHTTVHGQSGRPPDHSHLAPAGGGSSRCPKQAWSHTPVYGCLQGPVWRGKRAVSLGSLPHPSGQWQQHCCTSCCTLGPAGHHKGASGGARSPASVSQARTTRPPSKWPSIKDTQRQHATYNRCRTRVWQPWQQQVITPHTSTRLLHNHPTCNHLSATLQAAFTQIVSKISQICTKYVTLFTSLSEHSGRLFMPSDCVKSYLQKWQQL